MARIALVGKSGSGKTSVAKYLQDLHGYVIATTGAACREVTRRLFDSDEREFLNKVTDAMKAIRPSVWMDTALRDIGLEADVVFDSARFLVDYDTLARRGFVFVRVLADTDVRHERLARRGQIHTAQDDHHPAECELDEVSVLSVVQNNGLMEDLHRQVEDVITALGAAT